MLEELVYRRQPVLLTKYTRNPYIILMMLHVAETLYPLVNDAKLKSHALAQPHATLQDVTYHIDRYGKQGLFRDNDPAEHPIHTHGVSLKESHPGLRSTRGPLAIAARLRKDKQ